MFMSTQIIKVKFLSIIFICLFLSCSVKEKNKRKTLTPVELIQNSITEKTCSFDLLKEVDKYFYLTSFKTDTVEIYNLLKHYNDRFTNAENEKAFGVCTRDIEICECCKEMIWSLLLINHSLSLNELSSKERIEAFYKSASTFSDNSKIAYDLKDHYIRYNTVKEIKQTYLLLDKVHKTFLLGNLSDDANLEDVIIDIKKKVYLESKCKN